MIIAIDGTSGSGKSSAAELFSERKCLTLLNTGSLYRFITQECLKKEIEIEQTNAVIKIAKECDFNRVDLKNLYNEDISKAVPLIAKIPEVRSIVRDYQVESSKKGNIVVEGRDIGSVVFPDAEIKFFITASSEIRAERRYKQLISKGESVEYENILQNLIERDDQDRTRKTSPLIIADDAIIIDSSTLTLEAVVKRLEEEYKKKKVGRNND